MSTNKRHAAPLALFMVIMAVLSLMPTDTVEEKIKRKFSSLVILKSNIESYIKAPLDVSFIQNILHFPFYVLFAFLWVGFLNRRRIGFKKAI